MLVTSTTTHMIQGCRMSCLRSSSHQPDLNYLFFCIVLLFFSFYFHIPNCIQTHIFFVNSTHPLAFRVFCTHNISFEIFCFSVCNDNYLITLIFTCFQNSYFFAITNILNLLFLHMFYLIISMCYMSAWSVVHIIWQTSTWIYTIFRQVRRRTL